MVKYNGVFFGFKTNLPGTVFIQRESESEEIAFHILWPEVEFMVVTQSHFPHLDFC